MDGAKAKNRRKAAIEETSEAMLVCEVVAGVCSILLLVDFKHFC